MYRSNCKHRRSVIGTDQVRLFSSCLFVYHISLSAPTNWLQARLPAYLCLASKKTLKAVSLQISFFTLRDQLDPQQKRLLRVEEMQRADWLICQSTSTFDARQVVNNCGLLRTGENSIKSSFFLQISSRRSFAESVACDFACDSKENTKEKTVQNILSAKGIVRFEYEYEIKYENDFSILLCRPRIITTHTLLIP